MTTSREQAVQRVRDAAQRVAVSHGLEIFDLQFRRESIGWVLRVMVDRPWDSASGPERQEDAVGIEDCQKVSHDLGTLLDVEDDLGAALDRAYTLEVSSPGLDRPLKQPAHYARYTGARIDLSLKQPLAGRRNFRGRLAAAEAGWRLELEDAGGAASGQALDFTLDEVREARLVPVIDFKGRGARAPKARPAAGLDGGRKE